MKADQKGKHSVREVDWVTYGKRISNESRDRDSMRTGDEKKG